MRYLVYTVADTVYLDIARYMMHTVRTHTRDVDLLIITDHHNNPDSTGPWDFAMAPRRRVASNIPKPVQASMSKLDIVDFPGISSYDAVMYLDADIVVTGSLRPLFDLMYTHALYVVAQGSEHTLPYFSQRDIPYTQEQLALFDRREIKPFNAGQFGFRVAPAMLEQFRAIRESMKQYDSTVHFYEQSFMNHHFNLSWGTRPDIAPYVRLNAMAATEDENDCVVIHHFCNASIPVDVKFQAMRDLYRRYLVRGLGITRTIESRSQMVDITGPCKRITEIGTFRGDFAAELLHMYDPTLLVLVDPWEGTVVSGDADGNDVRSYDGETCFQEVRERFRDSAAVVMRCRSDEISLCDMDLVYIDGDHSYEGVRRDLELALQWVSSRGWICGHDYGMNPAKTRARYDFGVRRAVEDFCTHYGFRVHTLMLDGCISFAIQI